MIDITLHGNPQSTNHIYRHRGSITYMTKEGKDLKESYKLQLKNQYKRKPIEGEVDLRVELFFGDKRVRDIDNYNKILLDACTGILWIDDKQIMSLYIVKNYDKENPRIELTL